MSIPWKNSKRRMICILNIYGTFYGTIKTIIRPP
jgi:hypothetical protein